MDAAPDETIAAFATLWYDRVNQVVQIEPAGCDPGYRRLGLTRAAMLHGLRTAGELGAREALVRSFSRNVEAQQLYESCGFRVVSQRFGYSKLVA